jgi:hypothetical protein
MCLIWTDNIMVVLYYDLLHSLYILLADTKMNMSITIGPYNIFL